MIKELKMRITALLVLTLYVLALVPAVEYESAFSKGKIKLDYYLERASESESEEKFLELAEYGVTQALCQWQSEYLFLKDKEIAGVSSKELAEEYSRVKNEYELIKAKTYVNFISELYIKEKTKGSFSELTLNLKKASESEEFKFTNNNAISDVGIIKKWNERALSIIDEYLIKADTDGNYNKDLIKAKNEEIKKEGELLLNAYKNSILLKFYADNESAMAKSAKERAEIYTKDLISQIDSKTQKSVDNLLNSLETQLKHESSVDFDSEDFLEQFKSIYERAIDEWEKSETEFLGERIKFEGEANKVYEESVRVWQEAFEKFNEKKDSWVKQINQKIKDLQEQSTKQNKDFADKLDSAILEYTEAMGKQKQVYYEVLKTAVESYERLRLLLSTSKDEIDNWVCLWSEKYKNLYAYWKSEDGESCEDENPLKKSENSILYKILYRAENSKKIDLFKLSDSDIEKLKEEVKSIYSAHLAKLKKEYGKALDKRKDEIESLCKEYNSIVEKYFGDSANEISLSENEINTKKISFEKLKDKKTSEETIDKYSKELSEKIKNLCLKFDGESESYYWKNNGDEEAFYKIEKIREKIKEKLDEYFGLYQYSDFSEKIEQHYQEYKNDSDKENSIKAKKLKKLTDYVNSVKEGTVLNKESEFEISASFFESGKSILFWVESIKNLFPSLKESLNNIKETKKLVLKENSENSSLGGSGFSTIELEILKAEKDIEVLEEEKDIEQAIIDYAEVEDNKRSSQEETDNEEKKSKEKYEKALIEYESKREKLKDYKKNIENAQNALVEAKKAVEEAKLEVEQAQIDYDKKKVLSESKSQKKIYLLQIKNKILEYQETLKNVQKNNSKSAGFYQSCVKQMAEAVAGEIGKKYQNGMDEQKNLMQRYLQQAHSKTIELSSDFSNNAILKDVNQYIKECFKKIEAIEGYTDISDYERNERTEAYYFVIEEIFAGAMTVIEQLKLISNGKRSNKIYLSAYTADDTDINYSADAYYADSLIRKIAEKFNSILNKKDGNLYKEAKSKTTDSVIEKYENARKIIQKKLKGEKTYTKENNSYNEIIAYHDGLKNICTPCDNVIDEKNDVNTVDEKNILIKEYKKVEETEKNGEFYLVAAQRKALENYLECYLDEQAWNYAQNCGKTANDIENELLQLMNNVEEEFYDYIDGQDGKKNKGKLKSGKTQSEYQKAITEKMLSTEYRFLAKVMSFIDQSYSSWKAELNSLKYIDEIKTSDVEGLKDSELGKQLKEVIENDDKIDRYYKKLKEGATKYFTLELNQLKAEESNSSYEKDRKDYTESLIQVVDSLEIAIKKLKEFNDESIQGTLNNLSSAIKDKKNNLAEKAALLETKTKDYKSACDSYQSKINSVNQNLKALDRLRLEWRKKVRVNEWAKSVYLYDDYKNSDEENGYICPWEKVKNLKKKIEIQKAYLSALRAASKNQEENPYCVEEATLKNVTDSYEKLTGMLGAIEAVENKYEKDKYKAQMAGSEYLNVLASIFKVNLEEKNDNKEVQWFEKVFQNKKYFKDAQFTDDFRNLLLASFYLVCQEESNLEKIGNYNPYENSNFRLGALSDEINGIDAGKKYHNFREEVLKHAYDNFSDKALIEECKGLFFTASMGAYLLKLSDKYLREKALDKFKREMDEIYDDNIVRICGVTIWKKRKAKAADTYYECGKALKNANEQQKNREESIFTALIETYLSLKENYENAESNFKTKYYESTIGKNLTFEQVKALLEKHFANTNVIELIEKLPKTNYEVVKMFGESYAAYFMSKEELNAVIKKMEDEAKTKSKVDKDEEQNKNQENTTTTSTTGDGAISTPAMQSVEPSVDKKVSYTLEKAFAFLQNLSSDDYDKKKNKVVKENQKSIEELYKQTDILIDSALKSKNFTEEEKQKLKSAVVNLWKNAVDNSSYRKSLISYFEQYLTADIEKLDELGINVNYENVAELSLLNTLNEYIDCVMEKVEEAQNHNLNAYRIELNKSFSLYQSQINAVLEQAKEIAFAGIQEWKKAEKKLSEKFNAFQNEYLSKVEKLNSQWDESYAQMLEEKSKFMEHLYNEAQARNLVKTNVAKDAANTSLNQARQKIKIGQNQNALVKEDFDTRSFVEDILGQSNISCLTSRLEDKNDELKNLKEGGYLLFSNNSYDLYDIKEKTAELASSTTQKIDEYTSKMACQRAQVLIKESAENAYSKVQQHNEGMSSYIDETAWTKGYAKNDTRYEKTIVSDCNLWNVVKKDVSVNLYNDFVTNPIEIDEYISLLSSSTGVQVVLVQSLAQDKITLWDENIFGQHNGNTVLVEGEFDKFLYGKDNRGILVLGQGVIGVIMEQFNDNEQEEVKGQAELEKPEWEQKLWSSDVFPGPSIREFSSIVASVVCTVATCGAALGPAMAMSAAIMAANELAFEMLDVAIEGQSIDELFKSVAKVAVAGAISGASGSIGSKLKDIGGMAGVLKRTGLSVATSLANNINNAAWSASSWTDFTGALSEKSQWQSLGISCVGSLVSNGLTAINSFDSTGKLLSANTFNTSAMASLNSLAGGLTTNALEYSIMGSTTFNLINLNMLGIKYGGGNTLSQGLLAMNVSKENGTSFAVSGAGTDISFGNITSAIAGFKESHKVTSWKYGSVESSANLNIANLLSYSNDAMNLKSGKDIWEEKLLVNYIESEEVNGNYIKGTNTININKKFLGNSKEIAAKRASVAAHEASHYAGVKTEAGAHIQGFDGYIAALNAYGIKGDYDFAKNIVSEIFNINNQKENEGDVQNWRVTKNSSGKIVRVQDDGDKEHLNVVSEEGKVVEVRENNHKSLTGQIADIGETGQTKQDINKDMYTIWGLDYKSDGGWFAKDDSAKYIEPTNTLSEAVAVVKKLFNAVVGSLMGVAYDMTHKEQEIEIQLNKEIEEKFESMLGRPYAVNVNQETYDCNGVITENTPAINCIGLITYLNGISAKYDCKNFENYTSFTRLPEGTTLEDLKQNDVIWWKYTGKETGITEYHVVNWRTNGNVFESCGDYGVREKNYAKYTDWLYDNNRNIEIRYYRNNYVRDYKKKNSWGKKR
ncbi:rhoptry family protein [Treponema pectinovorum]|uniref:hypothetical protein n=1 Tax=Treponema pectinovorum TaxID=164 RepID=UPI0011CA70BC|nr:hypothetical protein [Treponema pectinovorum]